MTTGAGADCTPAIHEAKDFADSRPAGGNDGVWILSTDAASTTIKAPDVPVDCGWFPIGLQPIDAKAAYILCAAGAIRVTEDGGRSWQTRSTVIGAASISFADAKSGFALAPTAECPATVLATTDSGATWTR
ncbi:MAG: WD40/YVTN/BNR-like repeat-containing protein [Nakamurella sp.]